MRAAEPRVVRVLDVPAASTLPEVHELLQAGLGWTDSHLHEFVVTDDLRYGPDLPDLDHVRDETDVPLRALPARFVYHYDFGDSWKHDVEVLGPGGPHPGCIDGQGACPPEDVGGSGGYAEFRQAWHDPDHDDHERLRSWSAGWSPDWTDDDRKTADALVRDTVGQVPGSVRLLLDLVGEKLKLTATGRLPRAVVRAVQEQRAGWYPLARPASIEDDLFPLAYLHDALRRVGVLRVSRGVLLPTKAAADDLQVIRRLRRLLEPDSFDDIITGVAVAELVVRGTTSRDDLARAVFPYSERWSIDGRPLTVDDVAHRLSQLSAHLQALDLARGDGWPALAPGPSARTLLPRATALAHLWRDRRGAADQQPIGGFTPHGDLG